MKENDIQEDINILIVKENIEEDTIKKFENPQNIDFITLIRQFKREGIENFIVLRKNDFDEFLSDYKRVLKENEEWQRAYQEEKDKQFDLLRENQKLNEYIILAPNLDEMTAMKYRNITEEAYIKGRKEEQQKAEQIIYEHYIPKQKVKDIIEKLTQDNTKDNESVKRFEEMRRNTSDSFYKKSYQTSIHKLNAQIETRKHIINILKDLLESEE